MPQITFRVLEDVAQRLDDSLHGKSRAEFARDALMAAMDGQTFAEVKQELARLYGLLEQHGETERETKLTVERHMQTLIQEMEDLRMDLATTVVGLLTRIGTAVSQDEAEEFVRRTLLDDMSEETD